MHLYPGTGWTNHVFWPSVAPLNLLASQAEESAIVSVPPPNHPATSEAPFKLEKG